MHNLHAYNPVLEKKTMEYLQNKDWDSFSEYLSKLSHSEFRTLGKMMPQYILLKFEEQDYWDIFDFLFEANPKAWLITLLKAAITLYNQDKLHFDGSRFQAVCNKIAEEQREIDKSKLLQAILPVLKTPQEVSDTFVYLRMDDDDKCIKYLLPINTLPCYFILFQKMKRLEGQSEKLSLYCAELLRKKDDRSFNLVSIIKHYFDLPAVKGVFSLKINPYELSRLDSSYSGFCQMMTKI